MRAMEPLSKRCRDYVDRAAATLFSDAGLEAATRDRIAAAGWSVVGRLVRYSGGGSLLITDAGRQAIHQIANALWHERYRTTADVGDVSTVLTRIIKLTLATSGAPLSGDELASRVDELIPRGVHRYRLAAPLHGIELDAGAAIPLGNRFVLASADQEALSAASAVISPDGLPLGGSPYLLGTVTGTSARAVRLFREEADRAAGVLAVFAAAHYSSGASRFRLSVEVGSDPSEDAVVFHFWPEGGEDMGWRRESPRFSKLRLRGALLERLQANHYISYAFDQLGSGDGTGLQHALSRALHWYADAQRDAVPVMQLVKYWSCAEAVFCRPSETGKKERAAQRIASILAAYGAIPAERMSAVKDELRESYKARSDAVHEGMRTATLDQSACLSHRLAHALIGVLALMRDHRFATLHQLHDEMDGHYRKLCPQPGTDQP